MRTEKEEKKIRKIIIIKKYKFFNCAKELKNVCIIR